MTNEKYEVMRAKPSIDLFRRPHKGNDLIFAFFGPGYYSSNTDDMKSVYRNSDEFPDITFRPATTSESISAVAYNFETEAKPKIFERRYIQKEKKIGFQLGRIARTREGVYVHPSGEIKKGKIDEKTLKDLRDKSKLVNGIWLGENDFAFAPYESFKQGEQGAEEFAESGLARALEHSEERFAPNLLNMAGCYPGNDEKRVNVTQFDESPIWGVVHLFSLDNLLQVNGDGFLNHRGFYFGFMSKGYASGVLK